MATPFFREGTYYCRLAVPKDLQKDLKKREIWRSLRTSDPAEAKSLFKLAVADIEESWAAHREAAKMLAATRPELPVRRISHKDAHALAGELYSRTTAAHLDNPGPAAQWVDKLEELQDALPVSERIPDFKSQLFTGIYTNRPQFVAVRLCGATAKEVAAEKGFALDPAGLTKLAQTCASALARAYKVLSRNARGDFSPDPDASRYPVYDNAEANPIGPGIETEALLELWRKAPSTDPSTYRSWSGKLRSLMKFAGKSDVSLLTKLDVERWRDHRIDSGISASTVSAGDLAGVRGILGWAKSHTSVPAISVNVAEGVRQSKGKTIKLGLKGFDFDEAEIVLKGTLLPQPERLWETTKAARRWVPWLCAYSGARVGEIGQLTAHNVVIKRTPEGREIWCMVLTPEDGSIKTKEARTVPLHPHLIAQGFLRYVKSRKGLPLFYDPDAARGSEIGHRQSNKVGENIAKWIRKELKITRKVQPNHAWRHRFETEGRRLAIRKDVINAITGHAQEDTAGGYGDFLVEVLYEAICKIPRYLEPREHR